VHDSIRGLPGVFEQVARGIRAINDCKKAIGSPFPLFEIICTISQDNYRHLEAAVSLFEGMGIDTITFVHQLYTPPAIGRLHQQLYAQLFGCEAQAWQGFAQDVSGIDVAVLGQTIERLHQRVGPVPIGFSPPLCDPEQVATYYQDLTSLFHDKRCSGPWLWLEVYPNGDIYPCHEFPDYRVGNILEDGFWPVWNGPRFRKFRCQLMLYRGFPGCTACRSQQLVDAFVV
jgi:radical SAM protein with 4Fe4S-binding SPASM domain